MDREQHLPVPLQKTSKDNNNDKKQAASNPRCKKNIDCVNVCVCVCVCVCVTACVCVLSQPSSQQDATRELLKARSLLRLQTYNKGIEMNRKWGKPSGLHPVLPGPSPLSLSRQPRFSLTL